MLAQSRPDTGTNAFVIGLASRMVALAAGLLAVVEPATAAGEFSVGIHRAWGGYAIPNGIWLSADYTGDGRTDVVHIVNASDYAHTWTSTGSGGFNIGTFRPWAGYAMPNGIWLTPDLNADGRADLLHVVNGADYVHPWMSRGDGTFAVTAFRPWAGYAMPNGVWLVADLNGDNRDDLVHVVNRSDYVHTWMSNGNGTFRVGTFRPWAGYAMPNGEWRVGDFNGDGRDDLVHMVQGADYVHPWLSRGDGTFTVGAFRPWQGYAIPNGEWHVGDFDGDNRSDILHVVANSDYVHTWRSLGNGTFDVGTFRPWRGYAMPNGIWRVGDYNNDGKDDIVHAVANSDYAHVWRSTTVHNFAVTTFSPWRGYAIPNGLWLSGDYDGNGKADLLHAVAASNYVHPWLSQMPAPGETAVAGIEIAQAVQDMAHSVDLVAGKTSVARAYLDLNETSARSVRGTLRLRNPATGLVVNVTSLNTVSVNPVENGNVQVKREDIARSLNFLIPATFLGAGNLEARLIAVTDATTGTAVSCGNCGSLVRTVTLVNSAPLRVRVIGLRYTQNGTAHAPRNVDFDLVRSWLGRFYPVARLDWSQLTANSNAAPNFSCNDANAQLAATRAVEVSANTVDARTHYYGLVFDGGFFMRGCAAGIPGTASPQTVASGPTGAGTFGWDNDGSYGDWYAGHEIAHTLGRFHIGSGCGESSDDPNYPYPTGHISPADGRFVGLDVGDAARGIAMAVLPGNTWADVMSYCANQAVSDYTYEAIRARLNAEDALPGGAVPADVGGRSSAADIEMLVALAGPVEIFDAGGIAPVDVVGEGSRAVFIRPAFAPPLAPEPAGEMPDLDVEPAYDAPPVIEPEGESPILLATNAGGRPLPGDAAAAAADLPAPDLPVPASSELIAGSLINVVATINLTTQDGTIAFVNPVTQGMAPVGEAGNTVVLRVVSAAGEELLRKNAFVLLDTERPPGADVTGIINELIPRPEGTASIELIIEGNLADTFTPGANTGGPDIGVNVQATLDATGQTATVTVPDLGPAPDGVSYNVELSTDGGQNWQIVAINAPSPNATIDLTPIEDRAGLRVRVSETTGFDTRVLGEAPLTSP